MQERLELGRSLTENNELYFSVEIWEGQSTQPQSLPEVAGLGDETNQKTTKYSSICIELSAVSVALS